MADERSHSHSPQVDTPNFAFAEIMGRLFELGFNTGLLTALHQRTDLVLFTDDLFIQDLAGLHLPLLIEAAQKYTGTISSLDQEMLRDWVQYLLLKGYLAGCNFLAEFLHCIRQNADRTWKGEICYLQCNFTGKNSLGTLPEPDPITAINALMGQFVRAGLPSVTLSIQEQLDFKRTGEFLNADTLLLLREPQGDWRLLCIDLSVFGLLALRDTHDLRRPESLRRMLRTDLQYLRTRSVFTNLSIDADDDSTSHDLISGQMKHYFTAFKRSDKETLKFIQAASYAASFYDFLLQKQILQSHERIIFHVVGYTDRAINAMTLKPAQLRILRTCQAIYQEKHTDDEINEARQDVIGTIERAANRSFWGAEPFATKLLHLAEQGDGYHILSYKEKLANFVSTLTILEPEQLPSTIRERLPLTAYKGKSLRDIHRALVCQELGSSDLYLFLTGHPGIGKTSALAEFLRERAKQGEGFLLLYVSPRKQVNLDILKKFLEEPACANFFGLTTNSLAMRANHGRPTVLYSSALCEGIFEQNGVSFRPANEEEEARSNSLRALEEIQENLLIDKGERVSGVLKSLCDALSTALTDTFPAARTADPATPRPLSIVATVAIQSFKRTGRGESTLRHLKSIFQSAIAHNKIIPEKMRQLAQRFPYFYVMIDEITGDEGGAEFLEGIHRFVHDYKLADYGMKTKIIVADASIVDIGVIQSHLSRTGYEPHKIYFRHVDAAQATPPLTYDRIRFKYCSGAVINANAYPASALHIDYRILTDTFQYEEEQYLERSAVLRNNQRNVLVNDILQWMDEDPDAQTLVYIQDKARLNELINEIGKGRKFVRGEDYHEIHANISEKQKAEIQKTQDDVQVVFMTASASRGLSFKRARHILVDIPHFAIEQNLMEILQVIYRGRGGNFDQDEKSLTFYLANPLLYLEHTSRELFLKEQLLNLLNVLLILKTAILTRIAGSGQLGLQHFRMIPIGGKSVYAADETFSKRLSDLLAELQKAGYHSWSDKKMLTFIRGSLRALLARSHIQLISTNETPTVYRQKPNSYLEQRSTFALDFAHAAEQGFDHLLKLPILEPAYLVGSLLIVPVADKSMCELYRSSLTEVLKRPRPSELPDLLACMDIISRDRDYPASLRSSLGDAILFLRELQKLAPTRSAYYEQESSQADLHYAIPLFALLAAQTLREYFETEADAEEQTDESFRELLRRSIVTLYPADGFLPIGNTYKEFPFLLFRSFQLGETRQKIFTEKYLFTSQEFNIINMLLAGK